MKKQNYSKKDFLTFWGKTGYVETWDGHQYNWSKEIQDLVLNEIGSEKDKEVLEIGCGAGYWTKFLCENSKQVFAIDLIPKPKIDSKNFNYIENKDMQFDCSALEDNSIDFAFSFGVFCHLSLDACESYLKDVMRVLKNGGSAIFMYSDDEGLKKFFNNSDFKANMIYGEFNDYSDIMPMVQKYDSDCEKILDFRDTLVLIKKK
jgi:cyclopropane fatty-acyl-phospholipid synthase-like methyltransferase